MKCISTNKLKFIALISMTLDHIGAVLLPQNLFITTILKIFGRIAMPIFCYLIVIGLFNTRNCVKYLARLLLFAIISEIPFNLCFGSSIIYVRKQNVFFCFFIGLLVIFLIEKDKMYFLSENPFISNIIEYLLLIIGCVTAYYIKCDYTYFGIVMIYLFYTLRFYGILSIVSQIIINVIFMGGIQGFASFALIPICMYNGEKGSESQLLKWLFYTYYPVHLTILYLIKIIIM